MTMCSIIHPLRQCVTQGIGTIHVDSYTRDQNDFQLLTSSYIELYRVKKPPPPPHPNHPVIDPFTPQSPRFHHHASCTILTALAIVIIKQRVQY